jgi:hypothetical protein
MAFFRLEAPYPALASTMLLPNPKMGNNIGLMSQVAVVRMEDGSRRSFVKDGGGKMRHRWAWTMSRDKMEEFVDFVERYRGASFRATFRERLIIGKVSLNPVEVAGDGRAGGWPGGEAYETTLEMVEQ